ncbi:hypothetical protein [Bacillus thuringiensis]|uniref:hypothetical protein n=1 Tax=Bacillus thuringiensis TaxID=1428 RepID=UPI0021D6975B|nr:hypothetical protein [Bacillus thuringiensis]MCU7667463.1 hypothetical protein [Bacillus thuringiensis]
MDLHINVEDLKENKPKLYEKYKLLLLVAGSDEKNILSWAEVQKHAGWEQTRILFNAALEGLWEVKKVIPKEIDKQNEKS